MTLAEVLSHHGIAQLHVAETEKYAHVTYFFNGGEETEYDGEDADARRLAARRADLRPEAGDVRRRGRGPLLRGDRQRLRLRGGQLRQSGHGRAHRLDRGRDHGGRDGRRVPRPGRERGSGAGGVCLVTADHGNAERMLEDDGVSPHTAHTTNPVPFVLTDAGAELREGGELSDLAPTVLSLLGIEQPAAMTGRSLVSDIP